MNLPILAITVGTIAQYVFSAMWYMPLFGKQWGTIHGFDQVTPEMQKDMQRSMMPLLVGQFVVTAITSVVFGVLVYLVGDEVSLYLLALLVWVGLVLPTQISDVLFGGTNPHYIVRKIAIMAGASLFSLLILAAVFDALT